MKEKFIASGQNDLSLILIPLKATRIIPQAFGVLDQTPDGSNPLKKRLHDPNPGTETF